MYSGDWPISRKFRVQVTVSGESVTEPFTPFAIEIDFAGLLSAKRIAGNFARHSLIVTRIVDDRFEEPAAHAMSEDFTLGDKGEVSWVIRDQEALEYYVYFDIEENGPFDPPGRIALAGNGDVLRYNSGTGEPLDVGIPVQLPVFVDWDGDGLLDMIQGTTYANTIGYPYNGTWFFRNAGSNSEPLYDDFIRLKVDDEFIDAQVFDAVDWNGNGLTDLAAKPYGRNEIHIYLNTGKRDRSGLPVLTRGEVVDFAELIGPGGQCGAGSVQLFDLYGDGRIHLAAVIRDLQDKSKYGHIFGPYYDNYILIFENRQSKGKPPKFKAPYKLSLADGSVLTLKGGGSGSLCDWNGDGVWDVMLADCKDSEQRFRLFRNEGTNEEPELTDAGLLMEGKYPGVGGRFYSNASFKGFILKQKCRLFRYFEDIGKKPGAPVLRDRGLLRQRNGRVSVGEYSWPWVCDWDGDGGRDIAAGCSGGSPFIIEETGKSDPPVYRPRRILESAGVPIWHTWGNTLTQTGGERTEGYWRPAIVDWDLDGLPDLLAPIGISHGKLVDGKPVPDGRLFFYKNTGTRSDPRYAAPEEILLEDGSPPMACHTAFPMDWDSDGRYEIVSFDFEGRLCLYRLKDDPQKDPLTLLPGIPLLMEDGSFFNLEMIYKYVGRQWGVELAVCDWDGRGVWDIVIGTREMLLLFRNNGSIEKPLYTAGERMELWGKQIKHSVHSLRPFPVDWDGTGRMDLIVGSESGWFHLFRRPALEGACPKAELSKVQERK
jgi:hypothetical protein